MKLKGILAVVPHLFPNVWAQPLPMMFRPNAFPDIRFPPPEQGDCQISANLVSNFSWVPCVWKRVRGKVTLYQWGIAVAHYA
jgi:hypothetical protein